MTRSNVRRPSSGLWFRLLMIAPGKVVTLESPYSPDDVVRRLRAAPTIAKILERGQASIRLSTQNNQRRFFVWIEPSKTGGTRLTGQMQTPLRVAMMRLLCTLFIASVGLILMMMARFWFGAFFMITSLGFLLLSQYERLVGRDLRMHLQWLRQTLDAQPVEKS